MATHGIDPAAQFGSSQPGRVPFGTPTKPPSYIEIPTWVVDEVLAPAKPVAFRLAVLLYRFGKPVTSGAGERRLYWRGNHQELARRIGASKPHIIEAERYLAGVGFLQIHEANRPGAPHGLSVPAGPRTSNNLLPVAEPVFTTHDGDDLPIPSEPRESFNTTSSQDARGETATICDRLAAHGVTNPERWTRQAGPARCADALDFFESEDRSAIRNPAAFLSSLVHGRATIPKPRIRATAVSVPVEPPVSLTAEQERRARQLQRAAELFESGISFQEAERRAAEELKESAAR